MFRAASRSLSLLKRPIGPINSSRSSFCNMAKLKDNRPSFSRIGFKKFQLLRGVNLRWLPKEDANDMFPVNRPIPEGLLDGVHELLKVHSYVYGCPRTPSKEAMGSARVESLLGLTVMALKIENKLNCTSDDIHIDPQHLLNEFEYDPDVGPGNMDFVVLTQPDSAERSRKAVMVEVKKRDAAQAFPQLLLAEERIFKNNHDQRPVYGFATTGYSWVLAIFDGNQEKEKKYRLSTEMCLFDKFDDVKEWKKGQGATIVKLVYGILASELEYAYHVQLENLVKKGPKQSKE